MCLWNVETCERLLTYEQEQALSQDPLVTLHKILSLSSLALCLYISTLLRISHTSFAACNTASYWCQSQYSPTERGVLHADGAMQHGVYSVAKRSHFAEVFEISDQSFQDIKFWRVLVMGSAGTAGSARRRADIHWRGPQWTAAPLLQPPSPLASLNVMHVVHDRVWDGCAR